MEFSKFLKQCDFNIIVARDHNILLEKFKEACENEDDNIQYFEISDILNKENVFYELFLSIRTLYEDIESLYDELERIAFNLEEKGITCYVYSYYINEFLKIAFDNSPIDIEFDDIYWINPKKSKKFLKLLDNTFGLKENKKEEYYDKDLVVVDGVLIGYEGKKTNIVLPETVKGISKNAFKNNNFIKMVIIPNTVEFIDDEAFFNCSKLQLVHLGEGITRISKSAFSNCVSLRTVIGHNVKVIDDEAFKDCLNLIYCDFNQVDRIGTLSFLNCIGLEDLNFIKNCSFIGEKAFNQTGVKELILNRCNNLGDFSFAECKQLLNITINDYIEEIGNTPFLNDDNVIELNLNFVYPKEIYTLFSDDCSKCKVKSITMLSLSKGICEGLSELKTVTVLGNTEIYESAFKDCSALEKIEFNDKRINIIDDYAFMNCSSLKKLNINFLGDTLGKSSFYKCVKLEDFNFIKNIKNFKGKCLAYTNLKGLRFDELQFKYLGEFSFANASFSDSLNLTLDGAIVEPGCFYGLRSIDVLSINGININSSQLYSLFEKNKDLFIRNTNINYLFTDFDLQYGGFSNFKCKYIGCTCENGSIPEEAFENCKFLENVRIEGAIKNILSSAFKNCESLSYVEFEPFEEILIQNSAFEGCKNYVYPYFSRTYYIGERAFYGSGVTNLELGSNVDYIGKYAFGGCDLNSDITLPFVGTSNDTASSLECIFSDTYGVTNCVYVANDYGNYYMPKINKLTILSSNINEGIEGEIKSLFLPNIKTLKLENLVNLKGLNKICLGKELEEIITDDSSYRLLDLLQIDSSNRNFAVVNGDIYSNDYETLYYLKSGIINDKAKIINTRAITNINVESLKLGNLKAIRRHAINLEGVKNLTIWNVSQIDNEAFINTSFVDKLTLNATIFPLESFDKLKELELCNLDVTNLKFNAQKIVLNHVKGEVSFLLTHSVYIRNCSRLTMTCKDSINNMVIEETAIGSNFLTDSHIYNLSIDSSNIPSDAIINCVIEDFNASNVNNFSKNILEENVIQSLNFTNSKYHFENGCLSYENKLIYCLANNLTIKEILRYDAFDERCVDLKQLTVLTLPKNFKLVKNMFVNSNNIVLVEFTDNISRRMTDYFDSVENVHKIIYHGSSVPNFGFANMPTLEKVILDKNIYFLGDFGFSHNPLLAEVENLKEAKIYGDYLFYDCTSISRLSFNLQADYLGLGLVYKTPNLKIIDMSIPIHHFKCNYVLDDLVENNYYLEVNIYNSYVIPKYYFANNKRILSIWDIPTYILEKAFLRAQISKFKSFENVKAIGEAAFLNSSLNGKINLEKCYLIGDEAFSNTDLKEVSFSNDQPIRLGNRCFANNKLETFILEENAEIGIDIFFNTNLNSIKINGNKNKKLLDSLNIKDHIKKISFSEIVLEEAMFEDYEELSEITIGKIKNNQIPAFCFKNCINLKDINIVEKSEFLSNLAKIGDSSFENCLSLSKFEFPSSIKEIGDNAFKNCANLTSEIIIPSNIEKLGRNIFSNCESVNSLSIEKKFDSLDLNNLGFNAENRIKYLHLNVNRLIESNFENYTNLEEIHVDGVEEIPNACFKNCTSLVSVAIPNYKVIAEDAFMNCNALEKLVVSDTCFKILKGAFANCQTLREVIIGQNVDTLEEAFTGCGNLYNIVFKNIVHDFSLSSIGFSPTSEHNRTLSFLDKVSFSDGAFKDCDNIKIMAENIVSIGRECFMNTKNFDLDSKAFKHLRIVPENAFFGFYSFYSKEISLDSVKTIASGAFEKSSWEKIGLGYEIQSIEDRAFYGCCGLKKIDLPKTLTNIGSYSFAYTSLSSIIIPNNVDNMGDHVFAGINNVIKVFVPHSKLEKWNPDWSNFKGDVVRNYGILNKLKHILFGKPKLKIKEYF